MNEELVLKNLKIIGKIPPSGRLCVYNNNTFIVENDNKWMTTLKRFVKGDSRVHSIDAISNTVGSACKLADFYQNHRFTDVNMLKEHIFNENSEMIIQENKKIIIKLQSIQKELNTARVGVVNLRDTTYSDDTEMYVMLEIIIGEIDNKVSEIENKLQKIFSSSSSSSSQN